MLRSLKFGQNKWNIQKCNLLNADGSTKDKILGINFARGHCPAARKATRETLFPFTSLVMKSLLACNTLGIYYGIIYYVILMECNNWIITFIIFITYIKSGITLAALVPPLSAFLCISILHQMGKHIIKRLNVQKSAEVKVKSRKYHFRQNVLLQCICVITQC